MSLINDALKRASNKKRSDSTDAPVPAPTFRQSTAASFIPVLLVVIILAAAGYGAWTWYAKRDASAAAAGNTNQAARLPATNNPIARAQATLQRVTARNDIENTNAQPAFPGAPQTAPSTTIAKPAAPSTPSAPGAFPDLKLQAIYYRLKNPSAVINGQTIKIGQVIAGVRVTKIERNSVTVDFNGRARVLDLK